MKKIKGTSQHGFTIVELIIVIIIIGVLTALTVVSYREIVNRSNVTTMTNDLQSATTQLEKYNRDNSSFPSSVDLANDGTGLKTTIGTAYTYKFYQYDNTYCLEGTNFGKNYYVSSNNHQPREGTCPANTFATAWGDAGDEGSESIVRTSDGGYAIVGDTNSSGVAGEHDVLFVKYDAFGNISWKKTWGDIGYDSGLDIIQTSDGGYAITGFSSYNGSTDDYDMFLLKYDKSGTLSWSKTWGCSYKEIGRSMVQTIDDSIIVTSSTNSYGSGNWDLILQKYDSLGNLSWSKTWGGTQDDRSSDIIQTSDGGYAIAGIVKSYNSTYESYIMKLDSDYNISWCKSWGGTGDDRAYSIVQSSENDSIYYYVTGYTTSYGSGSKDMFLTKYDSSGGLVWNKTWGGANDDVGSSVSLSSDGSSVLVAGKTLSFSATNDIFVAKFNISGDLNWSNRFASNSGNSVDNDAFYFTRYPSLVNASYGGFAVAGNINGYGAGGYDELLIKFADDGSVSGCSSLCQNLSVNPGNPTVSLGNPSYAFKAVQYEEPSSPTLSSQNKNDGTTTSVITPQFQ